MAKRGYVGADAIQTTGRIRTAIVNGVFVITPPIYTVSETRRRQVVVYGTKRFELILCAKHNSRQKPFVFTAVRVRPSYTRIGILNGYC